MRVVGRFAFVLQLERDLLARVGTDERGVEIEVVQFDLRGVLASRIDGTVVVEGLAAERGGLRSSVVIVVAAGGGRRESQGTNGEQDQGALHGSPPVAQVLKVAVS